MKKFAVVRKIIALALLSAFALPRAAPLMRAQIKPGANDDSKRSKSSGLENYDIRLDKAANSTLENFRLAAGRDESFAARQREKFAAAENSLRQRVSALVVEYNETLRAPEVVGLDVLLSNGKNLAARAGERTANAETLRQFIYRNDELFGLNAAQIEELKTVADYTNPDGVLSYAHLEQTINGIPVFQAEVKAGFTKRGEMFRVINNLAPALDYASLSENFGDARTAVANAYKFVSREMKPGEEELNQAESTDSKAVFGAGDWATTAEKVYFPIEAGAARAAWRVLIWEREAAYYVVVDAETGTLLWRKNLTSHQTEPVTYNVYANSTSMMQAPDSPTPFSPGPTSPNGAQNPLIPRTNVTLVGNEGANSFNNIGWITDGGNVTDGNNVEAGLDRDFNDGIDAPVTGSGNRVFNFNYTPGNPAGGENPLNAEFQKGAVTHLFYLSNRYHDELYKLGFTEAARNFQNDNFGRGGLGDDRISAETQDASGTDNANFGTPPDGNRGRMQMYLWTYYSDPDRDSSLDADIVIHELTHGLSNCLIGNAHGLTGRMSRGMGEGWSDFYGQALLSEPGDPLRGIYAFAGYSGEDHYSGRRFFPKAVKSFTGGAQNRPHNPLTFADIDSTQVNISDGAFPWNFPFDTNVTHNIGEVWASALWEVRARFVRRLGHAEGNRRILQFVTDGMKLTPNVPTFLQARDAIKQAATSGGTSDDLLDVRIGFAIRGMGDDAQITQVLPEARVVESFVPGVQTDIYNNPVTVVSETVLPANNTPDPDETLTISLPLQNYGTVDSGANVTATLLNSGGITNPSAAQNYGLLAAGGAQVARNFTFDVPASTVWGSQITLTFQVQDGASSFQYVQTYTVASPSIAVSDPVITNENHFPANNLPDPGETLTVSLPLRNTGNGNSAPNVTVTLLNSGGITNPSAAQNYGTLITGGAQVSRDFTFTASPAVFCGGSITLTFQVQNGASSFNFTRTYTLGVLDVLATETFDAVTAPALPAGWTSTQSGVGTGWTTSTTAPSSAPNAVFVGNPGNVGLSELESPVWNVNSPSARLDFKIFYNTETDQDGAVLEIKIGAGAYQDIIAAGGSFISGGYNRTISSSSNPLDGRSAWSGFSGDDYLSASINLPAAANGQPVRFRWRMGSDNSTTGLGVRLDDVRLFGNYICSPPPVVHTVNTTADTNDGVCNTASCSLREALDVADGNNAYDSIVFNIPANSAGCTGTNCIITLTSPLAPAADTGKLIKIDGGAASLNAITLNGGSATQILSVGASVNLTAGNLNFTGGSSGANGGAIVNSGGTLTLTNSALYNNSAASGGAISTVSGGVTNLTNVTVSGNSASFIGGGLHTTATVTTTNCTVTNNTAQFNGGVFNFSGGTFNARNTIIAGNSAQSSSPDANGNFTSQGYNLIGNALGANGFTANGDQTGVDARLAPLGNYGGKTLTHALLDGGANPSPAINMGTSTGALTTDQRGASRVGNVDKGAFELSNTANGGGFFASLPTGRHSGFYQAQIAPNNGAFTYSVTSGALPNGVSLTTNLAPAAIVALAGTPTQSGTFNFAITATNGTNSNVTNYQLLISPPPTAASVSISGRVAVEGGRGLTNAIVTLTDQNGEVKTARTTSFGYFAFAGVEVGRTYIIQVRSKRYQFQPKVISVLDEISDLLITTE